MDTFYATPTTSPLSPAIRTVINRPVLLSTRPTVGVLTPYVTSTSSGIVIGPKPVWPGQTPTLGASLVSSPVIGTSIVSGPGIITGTGYVPLGKTILFRDGAFYDDSGIGDNVLAQQETAKEARLKFLDKWLFDDYEDIIRMLRVHNGSVSVLSKEEVKKNDISKDSEKDLLLKSDFIGDEILTLGKVIKLLRAFCAKNGIKFYDIPHEERSVKKTLAHYVEKKLKEMQK